MVKNNGKIISHSFLVNIHLYSYALPKNISGKILLSTSVWKYGNSWYKTQSGLPQRGKAKHWRHLCTHIDWKGHRKVSQTAYRPYVFFM